jgi:8-oxo-dGTP diphosphatase
MTKKFITAFNIRVYGLFINKNKEILLTDEVRYGMHMTKFPGGGLQFGEGLLDCLKREALEELGQEIVILNHFYTTDFYVQSAFHENHQVISIYYLCRFKGKAKFNFPKTPVNFSDSNEEIISFRYKPISEMKEEDLSFPADRHVLKLLKMQK